MSCFNLFSREKALMTMAEGAGFGLWELAAEAERCPVRMDACAAEVLGLPSQTDFSAVLEICHPDDREPFRRGLKALCEQPGTQKMIDFRIWRAQSRDWGWIRSFGRSYPSDRPGLTYVLGSIQDIEGGEAFHSIVSRMNEANERTQIMLDTTPLCCNFWDENYHNIDCNLEAAKLFDLSCKQDYLDNFAALSPQYQPDGRLSSEAALGYIRQAFETGHAKFEWQHQKLDGQPIPAEITLVRVRRGNSYIVAGYTRDLREYKKMMAEIAQVEADLRLARDAAEASAHSKSEFLANMSHEIRTPMNAIKGLAELLALTKLDSVQDSYIRNIVKSSNSLLSIINDVLDFSKINAQKIELVEGHYLLEELIAEVSNVVSLRATEKGLMLLMDVSPALPRGLVGDDVRVKQVIINILNNAVKYTKEGHVILRLYGEETDRGFELVCAVEDTGIGIRKDDIPFLFDAFAQADRRVNHNIQGTGLGLSISDRLTRAMGGSITVESAYGKGSVFTARFPQRIDLAGPLAAVESPREKQVLLLERDERTQCVAHMLSELGVAYTAFSSEDGLNTLSGASFTHCIYDDSFSQAAIRRARAKLPGCVFIALKDMRYAMSQAELHDAVLFLPLVITDLAKVLSRAPGQMGPEVAGQRTIDDFALTDTRVLVVDDNEINLIVSGEILRAYKAEVTCAESGQAALDLCAQTAYDLIFMDHMMPGMDGIETTIALRGREGPNRSTPIIALTANVVNDMASQYIKSGMDDFIAKPIELSDLHRILLRWLPESKITSMEQALSGTPARPQEPGLPQEAPMERLIRSMDAFGMYVSDVMREIDNDYVVYIGRMERISTDLGPLVARLRGLVRDENWAAFAEGISTLGGMIHDVGARECSGRARKLANAARECNAEYIRGDFFSLMDNMYMLEKKMEVAVPLALGNIGAEVPFGDIGYCYDRLLDMAPALESADRTTADGLLDSLAHYSLDHTLDLILVEIAASLAAGDFAGALEPYNRAVAHCAQLVG